MKSAPTGARGWRWSDRDGKFGLGKVIMLLVLAVAVWLGVVFAPPYIENFKFQKALDAAARHSKLEADDNILLTTLQKEADQLGLRLPAEQIKIVRRPFNTGIQIDTSYVRAVRMKPLSKVVELTFKNDANERY
ncbi:MAG TPA: hypothetical protein PK668_25055 [Myxococcota bacterium]|nr:hypothetical protein [Myxococcota bacterium]HRY95309.1 hypothetical protein [Myxococcota bacterium]HSA21634.1 hypothetical protein [Myxococcota bacterium]